MTNNILFIGGLPEIYYVLIFFIASISAGHGLLLLLNLPKIIGYGIPDRIDRWLIGLFNLLISGLSIFIICL